MADKRISQLNSHTTPSGSDLLVIVNNNETKKITYADLKDSIVINSDNALLNAFSASYLNDSASFHTRITAATNEQSLTHLVTTSSFNILSASIDSRVDSLENWSSSLDSTFATDLQVSIVSSSVAATIGIISQNTGLVTTSSFNEYTASISTASLVDRLNDLESHTGSYLTSLNGTISGSSQLTSSYDSRYVLSGSITQTTWDNISGKPIGLVSQSTDISSLNSFTASYFTNSSSFDSRLINLNSYTSSNDSWKDGVTNDVSAIQSAISSLNNTYATDAALNAYTSSNESWKDSITNDISAINGVISSLNNTYATDAEVAAGYEAKGRGIISGSSQLTGSFDTRYTLSGSVVSGTTPAGTISGSSQLTSSFDSRYSLSGSVLTSFSSSVDNRLDTLEATIISGSINYTQVLGNRRSSITTVGVSIISGSITTTGNPVQIMVTGDANPTTTAWCRLQIFRDGTGIGNIIQVENSSNLNVPYCLNVIDTPTTGTYTYSMRTVDTMSGTFDFGEYNGPLLTAVELKSNTQLPSGLISGSSQLTSSYDTRYTLSGSVQPLPNGVISGSSQLTASYDTRYTLSGSVVSGTTPTGTISGSAQISAFGFVSGSYTTTSSFNSFTASAQTVTTGSNSFNGTQIITGSLIVTSGSFIGSQFTANTSSLYLTSGSNMYVQNNGLVEITGSLVVSGSVNIITTSPLRIGTGSGDEGGEIQLALAQTNQSLTGSVITDVYRNQFRILESGGTYRGVNIDLSKAPANAAGELVWKTSGMVNAGTFVTLDNIKATVTSSGNRGLSIAAVSTNFTANISAYYAMNGGMSGTATNNFSVTTTPTSTLFTWNFTAEGDGAYYTILDKTNNRMYRVTMMIGASYNNNFISIERLY
jgi:hypothetical protein